MVTLLGGTEGSAARLARALMLPVQAAESVEQALTRSDGRTILIGDAKRHADAWLSRRADAPVFLHDFLHGGVPVGAAFSGVVFSRAEVPVLRAVVWSWLPALTVYRRLHLDDAGLWEGPVAVPLTVRPLRALRGLVARQGLSLEGVAASAGLSMSSLHVAVHELRSQLGPGVIGAQVKQGVVYPVQVSGAARRLRELICAEQARVLTAAQGGELLMLRAGLEARGNEMNPQ